MTESRCERLVQAHLDGLLSKDDAGELAGILVQDQAAADAFAHATRFESLLQSYLVDERRIQDWSDESATIENPRAHRRWSAIVALLTTAAALLIAVCWWSFYRQSPTAMHRVVAGRLLVDGVESRTFADESRLEVLGSATAAIELSNGGSVELSPASTATVQFVGDEAVVRLAYGNGKFRTGDAQQSLRVETQLGVVSARAADFAIDYQPNGDQAPSAYFVVAVQSGQVEVQEADQRVKVSAGESRAFANEKVPIFAGKVVDVAADGGRITLEGKPSKPGAPPQRRELSITKATALMFHGVRMGDDHPTVGMTALATLDKAAPDTASEIEFGDKSPSLIGTVKVVSNDGRSLEIEVYRKGDAPLMRTIVLDERTRTAYSGTDGMDRKPTAGYFASVWLVGDTDRAAEVRFVLKSKNPGTPGNKPVEKSTEVAAPKPASNKSTKPDAPTEKSEKPTPKPKPEPSPKPEGKPEKPADPKNTGLVEGKKFVVRATNRDPLRLTAEIDQEIARRLADAKITPSPAADDAEFLRRATLDITGCIPTYAAARSFLDDQDPDKRRKLIDRLLADPAYGRRFGATWKRLIQPKPESNGKPGVDRITPWLAEQFNANRGWHEIVHELLTTEANLSRDPQAYFLVVNSESFDPKPNLLAGSTAKLFLGVQLACAECHDHPFAEWKQTEFWGLAAFFSRLQRKSKSDFTLREEASDASTPAEIKIPEGGKAAGAVIPAQFLRGGTPNLNQTLPLRNVLADWVTSRENPFFARTMVNRLWAHFFGQGLVEPLDGFQPGFEATHPVVLDRLTAEFVDSDFDLQHVVRIICNTQAYGRTSRPLPENEKDVTLLSRMRMKVLSPDVLYESLTAAINADLQPIATG